MQVPDALMARMRAAKCLRVELGTKARVILLKDEYAHFLADHEALGAQLDCLTLLHGHERIGEWKALAAAGHWDRLVERLLAEHYDPAYLRGMGRNYAGYGAAATIAVDGAGAAHFARAAQEALALG